ncbi:MAG TPA: hypothetical protein VFR81_14540 [Longimicrobium sp.]|nr:hypothetical protein [Longimicrobium sp.]
MTRKLTLDLDALSVSSFVTVEKEAGMRGTVNANEKIPCPWSRIGSCQGTLHTCASFDVSCRY